MKIYNHTFVIIVTELALILGVLIAISSKL